MLTLADFRNLHDFGLVTALDRFAEAERAASVAIVRGLLIIKERKIHLRMGYSSIAQYARERLGIAPSVSYKRSNAVKVAELHPEVIDWLEAGETSPTALSLLAAHRREPGLVAAARGLTVEGVRALIAAHYGIAPAGVLLDPDPPDDSVVLTVPAAVAELIERALTLDSDRDPDQSEAEVLETALRAYVERRAAETLGFTRDSRRTSGHQHTNTAHERWSLRRERPRRGAWRPLS